MSRNDTSDYVASHIQDALSRVPGVGDIQAFGAPYAMQIWLNPDRLRASPAFCFCRHASQTSERRNSGGSSNNNV